MFWTQNYSGIIVTSEPACGNCSTIKTHSVKITPTIANQTAQQGICKLYSMNSHLWNNFLGQIWKPPISALEAQKSKQIYFKTWISIVSKTQSDEQFASCEAFFSGFQQVQVWSLFRSLLAFLALTWKQKSSSPALPIGIQSSRSFSGILPRMSRISGMHSGNGTLRKSVGCGYGLDMSAPAYVFFSCRTQHIAESWKLCSMNIETHAGWPSFPFNCTASSKSNLFVEGKIEGRKQGF